MTSMSFLTSEVDIMYIWFLHPGSIKEFPVRTKRTLEKYKNWFPLFYYFFIQLNLT